MKILVIDNYDSFTYNLTHLVAQTTNDYSVVRNDEISLAEIGEYDKILLSPGPGLPENAGIIDGCIKMYSPTKSVLGVCLGLQAITEAFGGRLFNLQEVVHGRQMETIVVDNEDSLFKDVPQSFMAGRYHSWVADKNSLPAELKITAVDPSGEIMALSHRKFNVKGVQFHPESIMTPYGNLIIKNWIDEGN